MKSILQLLANIALLPVAGCIFPGNRDLSDDPKEETAKGCAPGVFTPLQLVTAFGQMPPGLEPEIKKTERQNKTAGF
jgi:hypothetical protein